ncbi:RdgB/HAM1 family non-canonical purine NTP pyrophosphatase [Tissierellaceae bacterium HCP3S3_D8]
MKHRRLVLSSNNIHKIDEIGRILEDLPIEVLSKRDIGLENLEVIEDGTTLEENSKKKAIALSEKTEYMVMADDSGIFVEALNGAPGVYSARYSGDDGNDEENNKKLLRELKDVPLEDRRGSFLTVITLVTEDKEVFTVKGECKGHIIFEPKGSNGFGYDSLFVPDGYDKTFGELDSEVKNKISHRAKALEEMRKLLIRLIEGDLK